MRMLEAGVAGGAGSGGAEGRGDGVRCGQVRALRNHPLHMRVKRAACECLTALVTGGSGGMGAWRARARALVRGANVTELAAEGLDAATHFVGSKLQVPPAGPPGPRVTRWLRRGGRCRVGLGRGRERGEERGGRRRGEGGDGGAARVGAVCVRGGHTASPQEGATAAPRVSVGRHAAPRGVVSRRGSGPSAGLPPCAALGARLAPARVRAHTHWRHQAGRCLRAGCASAPDEAAVGACRTRDSRQSL